MCPSTRKIVRSIPIARWEYMCNCMLNWQSHVYANPHASHVFSNAYAAFRCPVLAYLHKMHTHTYRCIFVQGNSPYNHQYLFIQKVVAQWTIEFLHYNGIPWSKRGMSHDAWQCEFDRSGLRPGMWSYIGMWIYIGTYSHRIGPDSSIHMFTELVMWLNPERQLSAPKKLPMTNTSNLACLNIGSVDIGSLRKDNIPL